MGESDIPALQCGPIEGGGAGGDALHKYTHTVELIKLELLDEPVKLIKLEFFQVLLISLS